MCSVKVISVANRIQNIVRQLKIIIINNSKNRKFALKYKIPLGQLIYLSPDNL